jgi:uncharacterized LabA/DUF88 family protein
MAKRIGIYIDVSNLYYSVLSKFGKRKLDYKKFLDYVKDLGDVVVANAYGAQMNAEAKPFISCLRQIGYLPRYKQLKVFTNAGQAPKYKANWDVGIVVDIIKALPNLDIVILGSADGDFQPLVDLVMGQGKSVIVIACNISRDLRDTCSQAIEIPESLIEDAKNENTGTDRASLHLDSGSNATGSPSR